MNLPYNQLNYGLDLNLNIGAQEEKKANGTKRLYKLKVAKQFEYIIFIIFILESTNCLLLWLFIYLLSISKKFSVKIIIKNNFICSKHIFDNKALIKPKAQNRRKNI